MPTYTDDFSTIPVGALGIIYTPGCKDLATKIDNHLVQWRNERDSEHKTTIAFAGYQRDTYIIKTDFDRFGSGEGKATILETVRGCDLFIISDMFNYGVTYKMFGKETRMSPDDHFANLKRVISATAGKARRITVIMPMLYEGRQHKRTARESLDCAMALQEIVNMGVDNIITFDAHDPKVQNAIPMKGFENVYTTYQMIKAMVNNIPDFKIDKDNLMIISPDEGGMNRGIYYASILGLDLGMFYKRRDYSRIVNGRNPIIAHEFLGDNVEGRDVIVVDDMISSGDSMIDVAERLKEMNARRIFLCSAFGLFCEGLKRFDEAYATGVIDMVFTTNLVYRMPQLKRKAWYREVDMSKYISLILDALNHDMSISKLLNHSIRIKPFLEKHGYDTPVQAD